MIVAIDTSIVASQPASCHPDRSTLRAQRRDRGLPATHSKARPITRLFNPSKTVSRYIWHGTSVESFPMENPSPIYFSRPSPNVYTRLATARRLFCPVIVTSRS
jgi:hypothetical protein